MRLILISRQASGSLMPGGETSYRGSNGQSNFKRPRLFLSSLLVSLLRYVSQYFLIQRVWEMASLGSRDERLKMCKKLMRSGETVSTEYCLTVAVAGNITQPNDGLISGRCHRSKPKKVLLWRMAQGHDEHHTFQVLDAADPCAALHPRKSTSTH